MSYQEMKEQLRSLGYPLMVSMESFRSPNFHLMATLLYWLIQNYDPTYIVSTDYTTEGARVQFVKGVAAFIAPKAQIKLNTRNLYKADGESIKELLKVSSLLAKAQAAYQNTLISTPPVDLTSKQAAIRQCRSLATEITETGAELYDLLGRELELREQRATVISQPFELVEIEKSIASTIETLTVSLSTTTHSHEALIADESNLLSKIEKKKSELERGLKRLQSLQGVRPAYMDDYERIESDLITCYEVYMHKFRNLSYLEQQLDETTKAEAGKLTEREDDLKKMQQRFREEEEELLRGKEEGSRGSLRPNRPSGTMHLTIAAGNRSRALMDDSDSEEELSVSGSESTEESGEIEIPADVAPSRPSAMRGKVESDSDSESSMEIGDDMDDDDEMDDNDF